MYFLSIDGGGTKTQFLLTNQFGQILSNIILGPTNYFNDGLDNAFNTLCIGIKQITTSINIKSKDITNAFIAMAGYGDVISDIPILNEKAKQLFDFPFQLGNDVLNAMAGSLLNKSGIHVIAGTGSICLGIDKENNHFKSGGWGNYLLGDEGSGYYLGINLLHHYTMQVDNREEKTQLYSYLKNKYNFVNDDDVVPFLMDTLQNKTDKIASLALDVVSLANNFDPVALEILNDAAKEIARLIKAVYKQSNYFDNPVTISYSGSIFKSLNLFKDVLFEQLKDIDYIFQDPILSPIAGGIVLAMQQHVEINKEVITNLKALN